jgi:hypothetical protein
VNDEPFVFFQYSRYSSEALQIIRKRIFLMNSSRTFFNTLFASALLALPSLVQAGTATTGSFTFTPGAAAASTATAVPALSDALLVALGLLLVVIAIRTLKANRGYQKFLSIAVLAGGLVIGGLGAETSIATIFDYTAGEDGISCDEPTTVDPYQSASCDRVPPTLTNGCPVAGSVVNTVGDCPRGGEKIEGNCDVLDPEGVCNLTYCLDPC